MDIQRLADGSSTYRPSHLWWGLAGGALFGGGLVVADKYDLAGTFEWASFFLLGTGFAIALFWGRRRAAWFWPTVLIVVAIHTGALCLMEWPPLAPGWGATAKGGAALDFAVSALVFYVARGLFDQEAVAKTRPAATAKYIKLGFAVMCLAIPLFLTAVVSHAYKQKVADLKIVFTMNSVNNEYSIMNCLEPHLRNQSWQDIRAQRIGFRYFDTDLGERISVANLSTMRQVQVETVKGRRLQPEEERRISRCLTAAAN